MIARVVEVFSSIQGEGPHLGERHLFIRFGGCNLHCDYCDEPGTIPIPSGEPKRLDELQARVLELDADRGHAAVSLTGGEPLLHAPFLELLLPWLKERGRRTYLETNGTLPEALKRLEPWTDRISMDVKLPSATGRDMWAAHRAFLQVAPAKTFVKVVVTAGSDVEEMRVAAQMVAGVDPEIPFYIQPATPMPGARRPEPEAVPKFLRAARMYLHDVRLSPQWHPVWGVR